MKEAQELGYTKFKANKKTTSQVTICVSPRKKGKIE